MACESASTWSSVRPPGKGRQRQGEGGVDLGASSELDLRQAGRALDPAEHLFDALAAALADGVARMTGGAPVDGGGARLAALADMPVDGDMRGEPAQIVPRVTDPGDVLAVVLRRLASDERATADGELRVFLKVRPTVRGGRTWLMGSEGRAVTQEKRVDEALVRALRSAHALLRNDENPRSSLQPAPANTYERRLCGLALMAPDIQRAILAGRQPADLTLDQLIKLELPLAWADRCLV